MLDTPCNTRRGHLPEIIQVCDWYILIKLDETQSLYRSDLSTSGKIRNYWSLKLEIWAKEFTYIVYSWYTGGVKLTLMS